MTDPNPADPAVFRAFAAAHREVPWRAMPNAKREALVRAFFATDFGGEMPRGVLHAVHEAARLHRARKRARRANPDPLAYRAHRKL